MTRPKRQAELPGIERQVANEDVEAACVKWYDVMAERAKLSKKEADAKATAMATMRAHKLDEYQFWDENAEVYRTARIESKEAIVIAKDIEHDGDAGEGVDPSELGSDSILADAAKTQSNAGVAENDEGDVVPTDASVPKSKKRGGAKKGRGK
jgi:hypothetical protein